MKMTQRRAHTCVFFLTESARIDSGPLRTSYAVIAIVDRREGCTEIENLMHVRIDIILGLLRRCVHSECLVESAALQV